MERKYLLKLEGRSTRNAEVFTESELNYLCERFSETIGSLIVHDDYETYCLMKKLRNVLTFTKPFNQF